jgi:hypothetical protein
LSDIKSSLMIYPDNTEMLNYASQLIITDEGLRSTVVDLIRAESLTVPPGTEASGPTFTVGVSITGECVLSDIKSSLMIYPDNTEMLNYASQLIITDEIASGAVAGCGGVGVSAPTLSGTAPPFVPFTQLVSVVNMLRTLQSTQSLSMGLIKQAVRKAMAALSYCPPPKPHAFDVEDMFVPTMFQGGAYPLPPEDRPLNVEAMDSFHIAACDLCAEGRVVHSSCYWYLMRLPIQNGWVPDIDTSSIYQQYSASGDDGNHRSAGIYPGTVRKEIESQLAAGICSAFPTAPPGAIINPLGVVIKKSDIARAKNCTGITIKDQQTLDASNAILAIKGMAKVKGRPITDATATGANAALRTPPFSNSGIGDAVALISPGCVMGKLDVSRYFHQFPMAPSSRWLFWFVFGLLFYCMNRVVFGAAPSPYFTSGYGAEVRKWVLHAKIPATHFCDDWFVAGKTRSDTERFLRAIAAFFVACGFSMAVEKEEMGQRLVYLGVMFDSIRMILSFDPESASSFASELRDAVVSIKLGKHLTAGEIRHIAGKLSHFSQVCQQGRMRITYWWAYFHHGRSLTAVGFSRLFSDSEWWLQQLDAWSEGGHSSCEYPILSSSVLATDPQKVVVLQSDASGPDGFGYIWGFLDEIDPRYYSAQWATGELELCDSSSHFAELRALEHFTRTTMLTDKVLFWITDSQSAFYTVNKGTCYEYQSRDLLSSILSRCDMLHISVLALWVPRDYNILPDYLSHLAFNLHRSEQGGRCSSL